MNCLYSSNWLKAGKLPPQCTTSSLKSLVREKLKDKNFYSLTFSQSKPSNFRLVNHLVSFGAGLI